MTLNNKFTGCIRCLIAIVATAFVVTSTFADVPDPYQNSGSNNIAYDLSSKFYIGIDLGAGVFTDKTVSFAHRHQSLNATSLAGGLFAGVKLNNYVAFETSLQRLGHLKASGKSSPFPLTYKATVYNASLDGLISYPFLSRYSYTTSLYVKAGYGINVTDFRYNVNAGAIHNNGDLYKGAYNVGAGINMDWRSNFSARIGYTYYQAHYPLPGNDDHHGANVLTFGFYYNLA